MTTLSSSRHFLSLILGLAFVGICILFAPYLSVFALAMVLGILFEPVNRVFRKIFKSHTLSAVVSILIVIVVILGPVAFLVTEIIREAFGVNAHLQSDYNIRLLIQALQEKVAYLNIDIISYLQSALAWILAHIGSIFSGAVTFGINIFLAMLGLFYWFRDADVLKARTIAMSPLEQNDTKSILDNLSVSINSIIRGTLLVALVQGCTAGIGFAIFGIPNAILWGTVTAAAALVPSIGTALVMVPMVGYLVLTGNIPAAIGLGIWGVCAVGLIDNVLGPKLMSRGNEMHPFFILMSVLGGISVFGPIGILLGPVVLAILYALLRVYAVRK